MVTTTICLDKNVCLSTSADGKEGKIIASFTAIAIIILVLVIASAAIVFLKTQLTLAA